MHEFLEQYTNFSAVGRKRHREHDYSFGKRKKDIFLLVKTQNLVSPFQNLAYALISRCQASRFFGNPWNRALPFQYVWWRAVIDMALIAWNLSYMMDGCCWQAGWGSSCVKGKVCRLMRWKIEGVISGHIVQPVKNATDVRGRSFRWQLNQKKKKKLHVTK